MPGNSKSKPLPPDPTTEWARKVHSGKEIAGPDVRAAAKRHLDDLAHGAKRGIWFDVAAAQHAMDFCAELLFVEVGDELVPFKLMGWQTFVVGSLFGWKRVDNGYRRFTLAYVEAGKGSGKTPLSAAIGLYMLTADGEMAAEVYACGANKEQARITFEDAVKMVDASPYLAARLAQAGRNPVWQISHRPSLSKFKPIASAKARSGFRVHCAIVDELHEHKSSYVLEMMRKGTKKRTQPLIFIITNSGYDRKSVCFQYHEDGLNVVHGLRENDRFFVLIFSLDATDDPLEDETCWPKTNPGIGTTLTLDYLREQVADARDIPGQESLCRRLNFCQWTDAAEPWITRKLWTTIEGKLVTFDKGAASEVDNPFLGAQCFLGLDLAFSFDLAALSFIFPEEDGKLAGWIEYFTPLDTAREREHRDKTPYTTWIAQGLIHGVPGKHVNEDYVARRLAEVQTQYDVQHCAYDRYGQKNLSRKIRDLGVHVPWIEHPQGFRRAGPLRDLYSNEVLVDPVSLKPIENPLWMPDSVKGFETAILDGVLEEQEHPVTRWQVSSTVIRQDPAGTGNRVFDKNKALGRIDGIVSKAMAIGAARMRDEPKPDIRDWIDNPVMV